MVLEYERRRDITDINFIVHTPLFNYILAMPSSRTMRVSHMSIAPSLVIPID